MPQIKHILYKSQAKDYLQVGRYARSMKKFNDREREGDREGEEERREANYITIGKGSKQ